MQKQRIWEPAAKICPDLSEMSEMKVKWNVLLLTLKGRYIKGVRHESKGGWVKKRASVETLCIKDRKEEQIQIIEVEEMGRYQIWGN